MSTVPLDYSHGDPSWSLPYRGKVGMLCLIVAESAMFTIFVVAYIYYMGRSLSGPQPRDVLETPILYTVFLLSSSITIWIAERALRKHSMRVFGAWLATTVAFGLIFLYGTAREWQKMIFHDHLTISTNLFGTTFYSLVGLHATHVVVGLILLTTVLIFTASGHVKPEHIEKIEALSYYWHFVDGVWVVVFTVVYIVGK